MNKAHKIIALFIILSLSLVTYSFAQVLWYNGDFTGENAWSQGINTRYYNLRMYDDFDVPAGGWTINTAWSNNLIWFDWWRDTPYTVTQAYWEIRQEITGGWNGGGQLIAGGSNAPATQTPTGRIGWNGQQIEYSIMVSNLNDIYLPEGKYWLSVVPVGQNGQGWTYITSTSDPWDTNRNNSIGSPGGDNSNSYLASGNYYYTRQMLINLGIGVLGDSSMGIAGFPGQSGTVPEPATLSLLGLGLLGLLGLRKTKEKA